MSDHYTQLFAAVEACRPRRILEIGTWDGAHGAEMIRIAQRFHGDVEYYGFDLWAPAPAEELSKPAVSMTTARTRLEETGAAVVVLAKGNTRETLPKWISVLPPLMDFIFIDGGHSVETIASDWRYCAELMHSDTLVVFDDYYPDRTDAGAKPVVDALGPEYLVTIGPVTEYPNLRVCMATVRMA